RGHAIGDAATGSAAVEAEHETRPLRRPAVDEGINAERPMRANEPRLDPLRKRKVRPPHQRAIGKHPEVFGRVRGIRIHGVWYQRWGGGGQVAPPLRGPEGGRMGLKNRRKRRLGKAGGEGARGVGRHGSAMMSPSASPAPPPRRWRLFLPFALMVLLAAAWTGM